MCVFLRIVMIRRAYPKPSAVPLDERTFRSDLTPSPLSGVQQRRVMTELNSNIRARFNDVIHSAILTLPPAGPGIRVKQGASDEALSFKPPCAR